ncbi:Retrovirus-related Pol polyprotein from transposon opus [Labeo rohita]|uniref:ribonuclease H n=1 Tax=Labeo rohita TaxID=84645 RepID=A0ABQ8LVT9_LABRO|nr:Retrovirus-related Pol polyprotein from transposon opus [Labeo rohita]
MLVRGMSFNTLSVPLHKVKLNSNLVTEELRKEQNSDSSLAELFTLALSGSDVPDVARAYFVQDGLLLRKWSPHSEDFVGDPIIQVVVPTKYHSVVLEVAHKKAGHLGLDRDWEEGLPWLLLAAREVLQESTGFSPNDLVFGHRVCGLLAVLQDSVLQDSKATEQYETVRYYRVSPEKQKHMEVEIKYMLENDIAIPSNSDWASPCLLVAKSDGSVGSAKFVTKLDLLKGYWQVPLSQRAQEISSFVIPSGLYSYKVMSFGLRNAPATFQRMMNCVVSGLEGCAVYLDDLVVFSDSWDLHLKRLGAVLKRLSDAKLTVNLAKCNFAQATITYLGKVVGNGEVRPVSAKVQAICDYPVPTTKKELMLFLDCALAFDNVKSLLCSAAVLAAPCFERPFSLQVDASQIGAGAVLQQDDEGMVRPVSFFSRKFNSYQLNYSVAYSLDIRHVRGSENIVADALSWAPLASLFENASSFGENAPDTCRREPGGCFSLPFLFVGFSDIRIKHWQTQHGDKHINLSCSEEQRDERMGEADDCAESFPNILSVSFCLPLVSLALVFLMGAALSGPCHSITSPRFACKADNSGTSWSGSV